MCKYFAIVFSFFLVYQSTSQGLAFQPTNSPHITRYTVIGQEGAFDILSDSLITAIAIKSPERGEFFLLEGQLRRNIPLDEDVLPFTYFLSLDEPVYNIRIESDQTDFEIYLIHSGSVEKIEHQSARYESIMECGDPLEYIPQSDWRSGLPDPNYTRSFHSVNHNIIHHSAGSNTNTNYTQVVRDIYLFHTEVNGWSDIGYNYLVAQDGTLYAGRDPGSGSQDLVRGAHFCGKNTGTLGVCLLGNFETAEPSQEALNTLESFLVYSLINLELDPFDSYNHTGGLLGTIAGHRDGCATLCPGANLYPKIEDLKMTVSARIDSCFQHVLQLAFSTNSTLVKVGEEIVFENESTGYTEFEWHFEGGIPVISEERQAATTYDFPGEYDVLLIGSKGEEVDSLFYEDYIKASYLTKDPWIFPNPMTGSDVLKVDFRDEISSVVLMTISGSVIAKLTQDQAQFPDLKPGTYLLKVVAGNAVFTKKLLVR